MYLANRRQKEPNNNSGDPPHYYRGLPLFRVHNASLSAMLFVLRFVEVKECSGQRLNAIEKVGLGQIGDLLETGDVVRRVQTTHPTAMCMTSFHPPLKKK